MKTLGYALALGMILGLPGMAYADLIFTLDTPTQNVSPGGTLTFTGILTNSTGSTLFLNGDDFTLDGEGLALDDTPFLLNAPASLDSGDSFTETILTVMADLTVPFQQAVGAFHILGGATESDQSLLATKEFEVHVVPEPGNGALLVGLIGMGALCCGRKQWR